MFKLTSQTAWLATLLVGGGLMLGCGGGNTGSVTGTVTVDGQPVDGLEVTFTAVDGEGGSALGYTTEGGSYQLIQGRGEQQIPAGEYRVTINVFRESANAENRSLRLPPKYTSAEQSELQATVNSGSNEIDFDLQTK